MDTKVEQLQAMVQELSGQLQALRLESVAGSSASDMARSVLEPKEVAVDFSATLSGIVAAAAVCPKESGSSTPPSAPARGPQRHVPQPIFEGSDFPIFLQRFGRWCKLSGLCGLDQETSRAWFVSCMGPTVLTLVEAVYSRTTTLEALVLEVGRIFPCYVTDFTLRQEVLGIKPLGANPTLEDLELLILKLENIWVRMTDGAYSDQEKLVTLVSKVAKCTWKMLREHLLWRKQLGSYELAKNALRSLVSEQQVNSILEQSPILPVVGAIVQPQQKKGEGGPRTPPQK